MPGPETSGFDGSSFNIDIPEVAPGTNKEPAEQPADTETICVAEVLSPAELRHKERVYRAWATDLGWPWDSDD